MSDNPNKDRDELLLIREWFPLRPTPIVDLADARLRLSRANQVKEFSMAQPDRELELYTSDADVSLEYARQLARNLAGVARALQAATVAGMYIDSHAAKEGERLTGLGAAGGVVGDGNESKTDAIQPIGVSDAGATGTDDISLGPRKDKHTATDDFRSSEKAQKTQKVSATADDSDLLKELPVTDDLRLTDSSDRFPIGKAKASDYDIRSQIAERKPAAPIVELSDESEEETIDSGMVSAEVKKALSVRVAARFYDLFGVLSFDQRNVINPSNGYEAYSLELSPSTADGHITFKRSDGRVVQKWRPPLGDTTDKRWIAFEDALLKSLRKDYEKVPFGAFKNAIDTYRHTKWRLQVKKRKTDTAALKDKRQKWLQCRVQLWKNSPFANHPQGKHFGQLLLTLLTVPRQFAYGQFQDFEEGPAEYLKYLPIGTKKTGGTLLRQDFGWMSKEVRALVHLYDEWVSLSSAATSTGTGGLGRTKTAFPASPQTKVDDKIYSLPEVYNDRSRPPRIDLPSTVTDYLPGGLTFATLYDQLCKIEVAGHVPSALKRCRMAVDPIKEAKKSATAAIFESATRKRWLSPPMAPDLTGKRDEFFRSDAHKRKRSLSPPMDWPALSSDSEDDMVEKKRFKGSKRV